jgi:hypothetical protein
MLDQRLVGCGVAQTGCRIDVDQHTLAGHPGWRGLLADSSRQLAMSGDLSLGLRQFIGNLIKRGDQAIY